MKLRIVAGHLELRMTREVNVLSSRQRNEQSGPLERLMSVFKEKTEPKQLLREFNYSALGLRPISAQR